MFLDYLLDTKEKSSRPQDQKPVKVNQYWTAEEQKHLEELLVKFPPEEIESRRWEKIANCLENRTPIQVASRVQKYFIKLLKAGMPIPGRMPNMTYLKKPRRNVIRNQPSTFLVSHTLPVYMPEADEELNYSYQQPQTSEENSMESKVGMSILNVFVAAVKLCNSLLASPPTPCSVIFILHTSPSAFWLRVVVQLLFKEHPKGRSLTWLPCLLTLAGQIGLGFTPRVALPGENLPEYFTQTTQCHPPPR
ncbi:ZZ-type zinc finger-containing protein 3 [Araneus ventricosus]|uniref:ZZ-type zinc finger-containing protein 3 n=1 Tax=Araneus ventricosus TaxID=182803 RepID=A0A4Y2GRZ3_ARAVE|nr:ZZ-type zinc finger-containing protein 3 [Araneus ventricosus]